VAFAASRCCPRRLRLPLVLQTNGKRFEKHSGWPRLAERQPAQAARHCFEALYAQMLLTGNGYLNWSPLIAGALSELHVLRSDRMSLTPARMAARA